MQTFTGGVFYPEDPHPEDFCIEDIAHALSIENRFGGHLPEPYSVAQHSVLVYRIVRDRLPTEASKNIWRWALLHDSSEAYIKDIPRPVKRALGESYKQLEDRVMNAICTKFDLDPAMPPIVKEADNCALLIEKRDLYRAADRHNWQIDGRALPDFHAGFIGWPKAEFDFLSSWDEVKP